MEQPLESNEVQRSVACSKFGRFSLAVVIFIFGCVVGGSGVWVYGKLVNFGRNNSRPPYDSPDKMKMRFIDNVRSFGELTPQQEVLLGEAYSRYYQQIMEHRKRIHTEIAQNQAAFDKEIASIISESMFDLWSAQPQPWLKRHKYGNKMRKLDGSGPNGRGSGMQSGGMHGSGMQDGSMSVNGDFRSAEQAPPPPPPERNTPAPQMPQGPTR